MAILAAGMLVLGAVALAFAAHAFIRQQAFLSRAQFTVGEVVRNVRRTGEGGWLYRAVVEFETDEGRIMTFEDSAESSWIRHQRGDEVPVIYDPGRPGEARIDSFGGLWLPCLVTSVVALVLVLFGALVGALALVQS